MMRLLAPCLRARNVALKCSVTGMLGLVLMALLCSMLGACASGQQSVSVRSDGQRATRPWPTAGHLVIVGGGLEDDNELIYARFLTLAGAGPVLIIPTASGQWAEAAKAAEARFRRYAPSTVEIASLPISQQDLALASDPAIVRRIDAARGIWLTGGDQSRITRVFRPDGVTSPALAAMDRLLARGGVIGGTSAGAAIMSDPMIAGGRATTQRKGETRDAENPAPSEDQAPPAGVRFAPGLGFFPYGLVDQHFLERNRMPRLLEALETSKISTGFGVNENCAMIVDLKARTIEGIGTPGVIVITPTPAATRATILSTGHNLKLETR